ncbi:MAG: hypothetical protein JW891_14740 [Candidatus Lokiarchaeota archaeon]|nr:hypothetical protein [Candidatus Lokiarchaeota archaeon]
MNKNNKLKCSLLIVAIVMSIILTVNSNASSNARAIDEPNISAVGETRNVYTVYCWNANIVSGGTSSLRPNDGEQLRVDGPAYYEPGDNYLCAIDNNNPVTKTASGANHQGTSTDWSMKKGDGKFCYITAEYWSASQSWVAMEFDYTALSTSHAMPENIEIDLYVDNVVYSFIPSFYVDIKNYHTNSWEKLYGSNTASIEGQDLHFDKSDLNDAILAHYINYNTDRVTVRVRGYAGFIWVFWPFSAFTQCGISVDLLHVKVSYESKSRLYFPFDPALRGEDYKINFQGQVTGGSADLQVNGESFQMISTEVTTIGGECEQRIQDVTAIEIVGRFDSLIIDHLYLEECEQITDTTPPNVYIINPIDYGPILDPYNPVPVINVEGVYNISVYASDNVGVTKIDYFVDGECIRQDREAPFTCQWDTTQYQDGLHLVNVVAYDSSGNIATSLDTKFTVDNIAEKIAVYYWASNLFEIISAEALRNTINIYNEVLWYEGYHKSYYFEDSLDFDADFQKVADNEGEKDRIFFYLLGHGNYDGADSETWFNSNLQPIESSNFRELVENLDTNEVGILVDSCHSGGWVDDFWGTDYLVISSTNRDFGAVFNPINAQGEFSFDFFSGISWYGHDAVTAYEYAKSGSITFPCINVGSYTFFA